MGQEQSLLRQATTPRGYWKVLLMVYFLYRACRVGDFASQSAEDRLRLLYGWNRELTNSLRRFGGPGLHPTVDGDTGREITLLEYLVPHGGVDGEPESVQRGVQRLFDDPYYTTLVNDFHDTYMEGVRAGENMCPDTYDYAYFLFLLYMKYQLKNRTSSQEEALQNFRSFVLDGQANVLMPENVRQFYLQHTPAPAGGSASYVLGEMIEGFRQASRRDRFRFRVPRERAPSGDVNFRRRPRRPRPREPQNPLLEIERQLMLGRNRGARRDRGDRRFAPAA